MRDLLYILLEGLFFVLFAAGGILLAVEGVRFGRKHGVGGDEWSAKKSEKEKSFALKGVITWVGFGVACVLVAFALAYRGLVPRMGDYLETNIPDPAPVPTVTTTPHPAETAAGPSHPTTPDSDPASFKTPRGIVCSTYTNREAMACVIGEGNHTWGNTRCAYVFTLERTGAAKVDMCDVSGVTEDLDGYPAAAQSFADQDYGKTFDMGVAVCAMTSDGTYCVNSDQHFIRVSKQHSYPKV